MTDPHDAITVERAREKAGDRLRFGSMVVAIIIGVIAPSLMTVATQSTQVTGPVGAMAAIATLFAVGRGYVLRVRVLAASPLHMSLFVGLGWLLASSLWAPRPSYSFGFGLQVVATALLGFAGAVAIPMLVDRRKAALLAIGILLMAADAFLELQFGVGVRTVIKASPEEYRLNRGLVVACVLMGPLLHALMMNRLRLLAITTVAMLAAAVHVSITSSARLSLVAGAAAWALSLVARRIAVRLVVVSSIVVTVMTPFVVGHVREMIPQWASGLVKASGWQRAEIWYWFSKSVPEHWLAGFGLQSTRDFVELDVVRGYPPEALKQLVMGHPHNVPLQIWVELGAVGVAIFCAVLWFVGEAIMRLPARAQPMALATFTSLFAIGYVSHGAWQIWWIATIFLAATWVAVVARDDQPSAGGA